METDGVKDYKITAEHCKSMIHGVCDGCGGELIPMETVDNSGDPTYWAGCENCQKFCWGINPEWYEIARIMVDEQRYVAYIHMDRPENKNDAYKKYYRESQISGACSVVSQVLCIKNKLTSTNI